MACGCDRLGGLAEIVRTFLGQDPLSGNLFVFRNKSSQRLKILWSDWGGLTIYYRRLEHGTFRFLTTKDSISVVDSSELLRLLDGLEVMARRAS